MYQMPAEWEKHRATLMIWPNRKGSWGRDLKRARETFAPVYRAVTEAEYLYLTCKPGQKDDIEDFLRIHTIPLDRVHIFEVVSDDNWARDITPSILVNRDRKAGDENRLLARDFIFNAWGGEYNGLYQDYERDNAFGPKMMEALGIPCETVASLVLEGGSIHVDGEGTCMVTETCLLSPGRNPDLSREEIEGALKESLGCTKILWLPRGIYNDETDEHVDNVCCFIKPGHVLLNWCDDPADPQYELTQETYHYLESARDAMGRKPVIHKMPMPHPLYVTREEADAFDYAEGEDNRKAGERLAGSYVNFLRTNDSIILPQFGRPDKPDGDIAMDVHRNAGPQDEEMADSWGNRDNTENDKRAVEVLEELLPGVRIVPVPARQFLLGGGNLHCLSHEIPE